MTDSSPRKFNSLDSLRGLAALAVLFQHLLQMFWPTLITATAPPLASLWHNGAFAVRLFFVLSGFVLSLSFFRTNDSRVLTSAASRRYFRLYIPAATSILFAYLLHVSGAFQALHDIKQTIGQSDWIRNLYSGVPSLTLALREAFLGAVVDYQFMKYNEVLWTMSVELKGSLLVFATLALFGKAQHRWLVYGALIFILDNLQLRHFIDFVCGMALCDWHCNHSGAARGSWLWFAVFIGGCCMGDLRGGWLEGFGVPVLMRGNRWWPTLAAVLLVASSARSSRIQALLSTPPLVWLGEMSFALYLFHLPIICSLGAWSFTKLTMLEMGYNWSASLASLACIISTFAVAQSGPRFLDPLAILVGRWAEHQLFPAMEGPGIPPTSRQPNLLVSAE